MSAPGEREGVKGGEDPQRQEDHVSEFPETRPIEIEEHRARHGKPDAPPLAEKEMPEPGEHQAQGYRKDRSPHERSRRVRFSVGGLASVSAVVIPLRVAV